MIAVDFSRSNTPKPFECNTARDRRVEFQRRIFEPPGIRGSAATAIALQSGQGAKLSAAPSSLVWWNSTD
jgi:hypothetical protein